MESKLKLEFWGYGLSHAAAANTPESCPRCHGTGRVGSPRFPACCPDCAGEGVKA